MDSWTMGQGNRGTRYKRVPPPPGSGPECFQDDLSPDLGCPLKDCPYLGGRRAETDGKE